MVNKNYRIGYNFQRRVVKYLKKNGFNCIVQPRSAFPDIIAWKPFLDQSGKAIVLDTYVNNNGKNTIKRNIAFFVAMVECKVRKYLSKEEKEKAKKLLLNGVCDSFFIAYRTGRKLEFQEFFIKSKPKKIANLPKPSYCD